jgi:hypothetical protein
LRSPPIARCTASSAHHPDLPAVFREIVTVEASAVGVDEAKQEVHHATLDRTAAEGPSSNRREGKTRVPPNLKSGRLASGSCGRLMGPGGSLPTNRIGERSDKDQLSIINAKGRCLQGQSDGIVNRMDC